MDSEYRILKNQPIKFKKVLHDIFNISVFKAFVMSVIAMAGAFFAPIYTFVLGSISLVVIDHLTGVKAAKKRGEPVTSTRMRDGVEKCFIYFCFIIAAHVVDTVFSIPYDPLSYMAAAGVARIEFLSIDENVNSMTGVSIAEHIQHVFTFKPKIKKK